MRGKRFLVLGLLGLLLVVPASAAQRSRWQQQAKLWKIKETRACLFKLPHAQSRPKRGVAIGIGVVRFSPGTGYLPSFTWFEVSFVSFPDVNVRGIESVSFFRSPQAARRDARIYTSSFSQAERASENPKVNRNVFFFSFPSVTNPLQPASKTRRATVERCLRT